jgi:hypothetical protein
MGSERTLLLIADIGGYTEYMRTHRMSLAHADVNTARLLEAVIDAAGDFDLIEIESDAAFLSRQVDAPDGDAVAAMTRATIDMHRAFHRERHNVATNLCPCDGCTQADNLKLKFVAHIGEVATQTIRDRRKLVGIDVILVHRLVKNPVQTPEYILFSEELYRTGGAALSDPVHEVSHDLEGIGPVPRTSWTSPTSRACSRRRRILRGSTASGGRSASPAAACRTWSACAGGGVYRLRRLRRSRRARAAAHCAPPAGCSRSASASSRLVTRCSPAAAAAG